MATTTERISVPEIHCDHCKTAIEGALQPIDGVTDADVDIASRTVAVTYDRAAVDRETVLDAIEAQGYEVPR